MEYDQLEPRDSESLHDNDEDCSNDREYHIDDDDDLSYIETGRSSAVFNIAKQMQHSKLLANVPDGTSDDSDEEEDYIALRSLVLYGNKFVGGGDDNDDDFTITSDEEQDLINEIQDEDMENTNDAMKWALELYQNQQPSSECDGDDDDIDPKLKDAILKSRKLDRILQRKFEQEKNVKRERMQLHCRMREELTGLADGGKVMSSEEKKNTEKFLALTVPSKHSAGIRLEDVEMNGRRRHSAASMTTPLFQTQPPELETSSQQKTVASGSRTAGKVLASSSAMSNVSSNSDQRAASGGRRRSSSTSAEDGQSGQGRRGASAAHARTASAHARSENGQSCLRKQKNKERDFLQRNIELAGDAQSIVAMTDHEKKRVEELLADLDSLPEIPEENSVDEETSDNQYQMSVLNHKGDGYELTDDEQWRLEEIDKRLKMLLPADDFQHIASVTPANETSICQSPFHRVHSCPHAADVIGEHVLKEARDDRELKARMREIEDELAHLTSVRIHEDENGKLSEQQMNELLQSCIQSMSGTDSLPPIDNGSSSCRTLVCANVPPLDEDTLRRLLADARSGSADDRHLSLPSDRRENWVPPSADAGEMTMHRHEGSSPSLTLGNLSADCTSVPRLQRSKTSNCVQRPSNGGAESNRRFFLPSIDRTGSVSAQRRPATSGDVRPNDDATVEVQRPPRSTAITVWNSLTTLPSTNNAAPADLTLQPATATRFVPTPPPRKNSASNI